MSTTCQCKLQIIVGATEKATEQTEITMRKEGSILSRRHVALSFIVLTGACVHTGRSFCPPTPAKVTITRVQSTVALSKLKPHRSIFNAEQQKQQHRPIIIRETAGFGTLYNSASSSVDSDEPESSRSKLRQLTGFSLTTLRATLRTATGFSLTAFRTTLRAATGISLSQTISGALRRILGILHPGLRYFLQPLLIMYYAPMLIIRYWMVGPSQAYVEESRKGHEKVVEGWRKAVEAAEKANADGYWPVHVNDDGSIVTSLPPDPNDILDLTDGIEKSVAATTTTSETS